MFVADLQLFSIKRLEQDCCSAALRSAWIGAKCAASLLVNWNQKLLILMRRFCYPARN
jgi:hypothetical protein